LRQEHLENIGQNEGMELYNREEHALDSQT